ncbi:MAG: SDR family oxidoreductase [Anaerolineae bacterium]|nr:SDR family oxidoreductase [Anaerolineae bacterium]
MTDQKKVVIITGAGAGIGKACAHRFAKENYRVVVADLSAEDGERTCVSVRANGGEALFSRCDVSQEADCQATARAALDAWGRIDALVANAGARVLGSILEATEADWSLMLDVNLKGVAYCCKAVLPAMIEQGAGAIVMTSSANALVGRPEMPLYDASKAALLSLTRSLAVAYGKDGIRVNAICPGYTITDFHEKLAAARGETPQELRERRKGYALLGRPAEPSQLAAAIYFMASDDASNITGQSLFVDGGLSVTSGAP